MVTQQLVSRGDAELGRGLDDGKVRFLKFLHEKRKSGDFAAVLLT